MHGPDEYEILPSGLIVPRFVKNADGVMVPRDRKAKRVVNDGLSRAEQAILHKLVDGNGDLVIANDTGEVVARFRRVDGLPETGDVLSQVDDILRGKR